MRDKYVSLSRIKLRGSDGENGPLTCVPGLYISEVVLNRGRWSVASVSHLGD
jgi:hypothetical protein